MSTTLDTLEWQNSALIKGDVAQELTKLKQRPGENMLIPGSATLSFTMDWVRHHDRYGD